MSDAPRTDPASHDPLIGRVLDGRYRILSLIAHGGMGRIYRAEQQPLGRHVALKVLAPPPGADADSLATFRQRFFREASICSKLTHPNTVRIYDYGKSEDGVYFIAMEFLEGRTLRQVLAAEAPMAPWRVIELVRQICASLAEAHAMGLIHRDLKPSNLIISAHADGTEFVNVVDFGLVKDLEGSFGESEQTQAGMIVGSPMYMSPEQILQSELTERTDIYSLGVIMYGMLTGRRPFRQESAVAIMNCHLNVPPPPFAEANPEVEVPANLEWVTMACLEKSPAARFANVGELTRALAACDRELRGVVPPFPMQLVDGRLALPPEVEEALSRRASTSSGSISASGLTLHRPKPAVVDATGGEGRRWGLAVAALVALLALALGLAWALGGGAVEPGPVAAQPAEDPRRPAEGASPEAEREGPPEGSTAAQPGDKPGGQTGGQTTGQTAGQTEGLMGGDAGGSPAPKATPPAAGTPAPARDAAPTSSAPTPSAPTPSAPTPSAPTSSTPTPSTPTSSTPVEAAPVEAAPVEPDPQPTPPEPEPDDWARPQSDVRDPWGD